MQCTLEVMRRFSRDLALLSDFGNIQVVREGNRLRLHQNGAHVDCSYLLPFINYKGKNGVITSRHRIELQNVINELLVLYSKDDSKLYVEVKGTTFTFYKLAPDFLSKIQAGEADVVPINGWIWRKFLI